MTNQGSETTARIPDGVDVSIPGIQGGEGMVAIRACICHLTAHRQAQPCNAKLGFDSPAEFVMSSCSASRLDKAHECPLK